MVFAIAGSSKMLHIGFRCDGKAEQADAKEMVAKEKTIIWFRRAAYIAIWKH